MRLGYAHCIHANLGRRSREAKNGCIEHVGTIQQCSYLLEKLAFTSQVGWQYTPIVGDICKVPT